VAEKNTKQKKNILKTLFYESKKIDRMADIATKFDRIALYSKMRVTATIICP